MYLNDYVKKFGQFSFKERPFTTVDALIFATLAYSNFEVVAPSIYQKDNRPFYLEDLNDFDLPIVAIGPTFGKDNKILLTLLRDSPRYKKVGVKFINKVLDKNITNQFYGITFEIPDVGHYIGYRGTDSTVIGWKEDLDLSYKKVIPSQLDALDYINIVSELVDGPLYIGGHSKGGNQSLFTAINISKNIRDRVIYAYTFDGNGLATKDYYESENYLAMKDKIIFVTPVNSIIGEIFYNPKNPLICKARSRSFMQHYPHNWAIDDKTGDFVLVKERTKGARIRHRALKLWVKETDPEDAKLLISFFVSLFGGIDRTLDNFITSKFFKIKALHFKHKHYNKEENKRLSHCLKRLFTLMQESKKYYKQKDKEENKES